MNKITDTIKMTEGSLLKNIFIFSIPLVFSQLLQVLFNMADIAVVGKCAGEIPLGAVGSTAMLVSLFVGLLIGVGSGINVKVAQYLGAKMDKDVKETVDSSFFVSIVIGFLLLVVCVLFGRQMLELIKTKEVLLDKATLYFKIYALGLPALSIFNFGNGVLSAGGDTKRPLIYLVIAGVVNVGLNFFFVLVCGMDVDGVALASIISEYISAILIVIRMILVNESFKLDLKTFKITMAKVKGILLLGLPAGFQNGIFAIANMFIQSAVNSFSEIVVAGTSAAANADTIVYNVMAAFYTGCTTFIGQNFGAGNKKRILSSYYISLLYSFAIAFILGIYLFFFGESFLYLFTDSSEVVEAGMEKVKIMAFSYCVSAFMDNTISASRGLGKTLIPTIIVISGSCLFRIAWIYTVFAYYHTIASLFLLYIFSWVITAVAEIIYFIVIYKKIDFSGNIVRKNINPNV